MHMYPAANCEHKRATAQYIRPFSCLGVPGVPPRGRCHRIAIGVSRRRRSLEGERLRSPGYLRRRASRCVIAQTVERPQSQYGLRNRKLCEWIAMDTEAIENQERDGVDRSTGEVRTESGAPRPGDDAPDVDLARRRLLSRTTAGIAALGLAFASALFIESMEPTERARTRGK